MIAQVRAEDGPAPLANKRFCSLVRGAGGASAELRLKPPAVKHPRIVLTRQGSYPYMLYPK
jgi:hypothetical protein